MHQNLDMDMEQQELVKEINLMPYHQKVDLPASPDPEVEHVPIDQGDIKILGDNLEGELHNISFNESQHKVVQSHRVSTLDDHTSPTQFEEQLIVSDVCKHPVALVDSTRAYVEATSSSVYFLIGEHE